MTVDFGSKRLVVGAHYGTRDWLAQRATAVIMALFTLALIVQLLLPGEIGYDKWAAIFTQGWMKVLTVVTVIALLFHAWVGVRDIWMDYVGAFAVRLVLEVVSIAWLVGCAGWAIQVIWRL